MLLKQRAKDCGYAFNLYYPVSGIPQAYTRVKSIVLQSIKIK